MRLRESVPGGNRPTEPAPTTRTPRARTHARTSPFARRLTVALATVALVGSGPVLATAPATAQAPSAVAPSSALAPVAAKQVKLSQAVYERRVKRHVNRKRRNHGLGRLRFARCTDGTAERWARHLAANDAFYHQSMYDILAKCDAVYAGETLGRGGMGPRKLVRMWMNSPPHRKVLLSNRSKRIGIGASTNADGAWVVAANFMRF